MKNVVYLFFLLFLVFSCGPKSDAKDIESSIEHLEEQITAAQPQNMEEVTQVNDMKQQLLDSLNEFVNDPKLVAPKKEAYLFKLHLLYSGMGNHVYALRMAERILKEYPKSVNRFILLESAASIYDMNITPRDTNEVKKYYQLLLKEDKKMDSNKRKDIEKRLKHLDLSMEEYILKQMH